MTEKKKDSRDLSPEIQDFLREGVQLISRGEIDAAEKHFDQGLSNPDIPTDIVFTHLGVIAFQKGEHHRAEQLFQQALGENQWSEQANFNLAVLYQHLRQYQKALPFYKQALLRIGDDAEIYERMGECCYLLGNKADAEPFYDAALKMKPDSVNAAVRLAEIYLDKGDREKALKVLQIGIVSHPDQPEFYLAVGNIYRQMGENERALAHFRKTVILDENNFEGFCNLAEICFDLGLYKQAFPFYAKSYRLSPEPYLLYKMGRIYEKQNKRLPATQMYEKWVEQEKMDIPEKGEKEQKEYERVNHYLAKYYNSVGELDKKAWAEANIQELYGDDEEILELQSLQLD